MFLLDTNVLSAMMGSRRIAEVEIWVAGQAPNLLFTTAICQAEIMAGLAIMPEGRRRTSLQATARAMFVEDFAGRIWPFDAAAAVAYADIFAARRASGRPGATVDLMIAAVARSRGATIVTRNVADFDGCGPRVENPWSAVP